MKINVSKKTIKKTLLVFFVLLLIIIFFSLYYLMFVKPIQKESNMYWVTIKGKVVPSPDLENFDSKPAVVTVYYPNFKYLCEAISIESTYIKWDNITNEGEYQITFPLTVPMEISLATYCSDCNPAFVSVNPSKNFVEKNIVWGDEKCFKEIDSFTDIEQAVNRAQQLLGYTFEDLINKNDLTQEQVKDIKNSIDFGQSELNERDKSDINSSLLSAHKAIFYAWQAVYEIGLYDIGVCIVNIEKNIMNKNDTCYKVSSKDKAKLDSIKRSYDSFSSIIREDYLDTSDLEEVKSRINWISNNNRNFRQVGWECRDIFDSVSSDLDKQEVYCERRGILLKTLPWTIIAFAFILGSIIGRWIKEKD